MSSADSCPHRGVAINNNMRPFLVLFVLISVIIPWQGASVVIKQHEDERGLSLNIGGMITQPPQPQNPDSDNTQNPVRSQVNATYSYLLYTDMDRDEAAEEVHVYLQAKLEEIVGELVGNVQLISFRDTFLGTEACQGPPTSSSTPAWASTFTRCAKFRTVLVAEMGREWLEDVFQRTVVRTMETYIDEWNESQRASYIKFNDPIEVRMEISLLLVGKKQLMGIYEYSFMADVMQIGALERRARENENPPFIITETKYVWQRIVSRDGTTGGSQRRRYLQGTAGDEPPTPTSNLVRMLVVATCAGDSCTDENLETFVTTTMDEINDIFFANLKDWSQTNYFRDDAITGVIVDKEDDDSKFIEVPELPPDSDYRTPGVQESDPPLWIWFAMLIGVGVVFISCVYATFCLTARDFQAARELRKEHRETKVKTAAVREGKAAGARERSEVPVADADASEDENDSPRSPAARRYFKKKAPPTPEPDDDLFDISESDAAGGDNIEEVPPSPSTPASAADGTPSPKKKKKKKGSSSPKKKKVKKQGNEASDDIVSQDA